MIIFRKIPQLQRYLSKARRAGTLGFVPTMGALHEGHLQLIQTSRSENSTSVASIFVNPAQFNDPADFKKYPITIENDIRLLEEQGCNVLFLPSVEEIYPSGLEQPEYYELGVLDEILEGSFRPGHFQGVCRVVNRLLLITQPDRLYLGQKDYQQCMVIAKLVTLTGSGAEVRICPTLREKDGLAMSSRNMRLQAAERGKATLIYQMLEMSRAEIQAGSLVPLRDKILSTMRSNGFRPDYFEFAKASDLTILESWNGKDPVVALTATFLNDVRLIDNMIIT